MYSYTDRAAAFSSEYEQHIVISNKFDSNQCLMKMAGRMPNSINRFWTVYNNIPYLYQSSAALRMQQV
jgi:hypothetical protein